MIDLEHVGKIFPGQATPAVGDLTFEVAEGEIAALVGPSGCGKSTTLRMINRLIEPTSGRITVAGRNVSEQKPAELRRSIGYVIQQVGLFPHRSIGHNIATVPELLGWDKKRIRDRIAELMDLVGLEPDLAFALSGRALGRPATTGGRRPCARGRSTGAPHGRAVRRGRPDRAAASPGRADPAATGIEEDDRVRDPRHRRSHPPRRPDGGAQRRRSARAVRRRRSTCSRHRRTISCSSSSAPTAG